MSLPLDPAVTTPSAAAVERAAARIAELWLVTLPAGAEGGQSPLAQLGAGLIDRLGLHTAEVVAARPGEGGYWRELEDIGRRFLAYVLPSRDELARMDVAHVVGWEAAAEAADAGALAAAFGDCHSAALGADARLKYRVGGYRGRPGTPLADHLIAAVVRPTVGTAVR